MERLKTRLQTYKAYGQMGKYYTNPKKGLGWRLSFLICKMGMMI